MPNLKKLSGNDLSELLNMYARVLRTMEDDFCHVVEYSPAKVLHEVKKAQEAANAEYERRYLDND